MANPTSSTKPPAARKSSSPFARLPKPLLALLMATVVLSLLAALWAGLLRLGWSWPVLAPRLPGNHGPIMVSGALGSLIAIERAVGLGKRWMLAAPALTALGTILLLTPAPTAAAALAITVGSALFVAGVAQLLRIHVALFTVTIVLGGVLWLVGNLLWLFGQPVALAALWWLGFLVVTVAGERLELSRMLRLKPLDTALFGGALALVIGGLITAIAAYGAGTRLLGVGLLAMALWLLRYDIAWRRIKAGREARFGALCLLSGYVWLAVGGLVAIVWGGYSAGPFYDAFLHSVFVGFIFAMIFAHAPIILPAVLGLAVPYTPRFYIHLVLLHAGLLLRIAGDLLPNMALRRWGGLLNALVLLFFLANTFTAVIGGSRSEKREARRQPSPP